MKEIITNIYEYFLYDGNYQMMFDVLLYKGGAFNGYNILFLIALLVPVFFAIWFYLFYKNPLATFMTWLFKYLVFSGVVVFIISLGFLWNWIFSASSPELLNKLSDPTTGYASFAKLTIILMALLNMLYSFIWGFIVSLFMKHTSKQFIHLPF